MSEAEPAIVAATGAASQIGSASGSSSFGLRAPRERRPPAIGGDAEST